MAAGNASTEEVSETLAARVRQGYRERFGVELKAVQPGVEGLFGGSWVVAAYTPEPDEIISDLVYVDADDRPRMFASTQELLLFLERKKHFARFAVFIQSKAFHALIFFLLLGAVFWAGYQGPDRFDDRALAVLGSVIGLGAGLLFSSGRQH